MSLVVMPETASAAGSCPDKICGSLDDDGATLTGGGSGGGAPASPDSGSPEQPGEHESGGTSTPPFVVDCGRTAGGDEYCEDSPAIGPVSLSDIAHFRPAPPRQLMEPDGWAVVGLPANVYALAGPQALTGRILGLAAEVRFAPARFRWDYGDGATAALGTPGGSWSALGLAEFDSTPTSHVYARPGEYAVRLVVDHAVEFRVDGSGWTPIDGLLSLPANDLRLLVGTADTVLVDDDCLGNPRGPGC